MAVKVVISQPMYFPWIGMFEQVKLCDIFLHYDDVQFSKGSFTNRVQIKTDTAEGFKWLTVPLNDFQLGAKINAVQINNNKDWKGDHTRQLEHWYKDAPFRDEMLALFEKVVKTNCETISELSVRSLEEVSDYYGLLAGRQFHFSSEIPLEGKSSERVLNYVKYFKGTEYITGLGALKYLDHQLFEGNNIAVEYMDYQKEPYPQQYDVFNPYVSILDLIANTGKNGYKYIISSTKNWKLLHKA